MKNPVEKAFYLGVCAASVAKNFVEEEVKRALDAGHISEKEGKKIVDDFKKQLSKDAAAFRKSADKELKSAVKEIRPLVKQGAKIASGMAKSVVSMAKPRAPAKKRTAKKKVVKKVRSPKKRSKKVRKR